MQSTVDWQFLFEAFVHVLKLVRLNFDLDRYSTKQLWLIFVEYYGKFDCL